MYDVEDSNYDEEWYQHYYTCRHCGESFMIASLSPSYCPNCGHEIYAIKSGNMITIRLERRDKDVH